MVTLEGMWGHLLIVIVDSIVLLGLWVKHAAMSIDSRSVIATPI